MKTTIAWDTLKNPFRYETYKEIMSSMAEKGITSGEFLPERVAATKINAQRVKRLDKQIELNEELKNRLATLNRPFKWIVLLETWCGDAAQNVPILAKMAACASGIDLVLILRDENPDIMDRYLTNQARSIPKLICLDPESERELGCWGPRPAAIQSAFVSYKKQHPDMSHDHLMTQLHTLYAIDKGMAVQEEFYDLVLFWDRK